jgi:hypothetical protein
MRNLLIAAGLAIAVVATSTATADAALRSSQVTLWPGPTSELSLGTILSSATGDSNGDSIQDGIFSNGSIDVTAEQISNAYFNPVGSDATAAMIIEFAGYSGATTFGMYDLDTSGNVQNKVQIFDGPASAGTSAKIEFLSGDVVKITVGTTETTANLTDTFGFYIDPNGSTTTSFYTEDSLNPTNQAQALIYEGNDASPLEFRNIYEGTSKEEFEANEFILAWEDIAWNPPGGSVEPDFNDMVVFVKGIKTDNDRSNNVPEPTTLAIWSIFGAGAAAVAASRRRRQARWSDADRKAIHDVVDQHSV